MGLKYYKNLDGIRAIAALMVIFFHFFHNYQLEPGLGFLKKISTFGQTGVDLFFVLSGFLITRILFYSKDKKNYFINFYWKRTLRIFPLYYLFLIIFYFGLPLIGVIDYHGFDQQFYYYIYLQNFALTFNWSNAFGPNHYWSLAVEEHFYLFWPLLVYFTTKKALSKIVYFIIVFALLLRLYMVYNGLGVFYFTFTRFDALALGALLAILELKNIFEPKYLTKFLIAMFAVALPTAFILVKYSGDGNYLVQSFKFLLLSLFYFNLIGVVLCLQPTNIINKILTNNFFSYTGKISFGLYVYHPMLILILSKYFITGYIIADLLILTTLTYLIASVSFYGFESHFLKLKKFYS